MSIDTPGTIVRKESIYDLENAQKWFRVKRFYAMNFDFFEMEPHFHREFEIMYIASGSCSIFIWANELKKEELLLREGEYVLIDCNVQHQLEVSRGTQCRILNLEISLKEGSEGMQLQNFYLQSKSLQDFIRLALPVCRGIDDAGNLHTIITELHMQLQNAVEDSEHKIMQNLLLAQFFIELGRQRTKKHGVPGGSRFVRKALIYLSEHFDQEIKVKDIAEEAGVSAAYLQRLFKEQTGLSLIDKMNELRIEKAKLLLETSRLPVTDIAVSVGFNNRQHFTYTFFKLAGCSPAVYRKHKGDYRVWKGFE